MGLGDVWNRTLVYFGIAEDEEWDEELDDDERGARARLPPPRPGERPPAPAAARARGVGRRGQRLGARVGGRPPRRPRPRAARGCAASTSGGSQVRVHLVLPRSFNDAQQIADRFKDSVPVILNLQTADTELSKRLIDFASGLTYALDGSMQRVADKVFLLTPRNVEVSAEERARALDPAGGVLQPGVTRAARHGRRRNAPRARIRARGRRGRRLVAAGRHGDVGPALRVRVRRGLRPPDLRVHHRLVGSRRRVADARARPAVPVRRLRALPAALPPRDPAARPARPVADRRRSSRCTSCGCS